MKRANYLTIPLSDAGSTCIGKDEATNLAEDLSLSVTLDRGVNLFTARSDGELGLCLNTLFDGLAGDASCAGHVFIRGVGAGANETDRDLTWPSGFIGLLAELTKGRR